MPKQEFISSSYPLANGKWVPRVTERLHTGDKILEKKHDNWDEQFDTEEEAKLFVAARIKELQAEG